MGVPCLGHDVGVETGRDFRAAELRHGVGIGSGIIETIVNRLDPLLPSVTAGSAAFSERVVLGAATLFVFAQLSPQVDTLLKC